MHCVPCGVCTRTLCGTGDSRAMSARAHPPPRAAALLAHLNLLLMVVGAPCLWHGVAMLCSPQQLPLPPALGPLWTCAGGVLVALGGAHWLLAHLALAAAARASAGLFVSYAALAAVLCCGEAAWLARSVTALRSADATWRSFEPVFLIFGLFLPRNQERFQMATDLKPVAVYLSLGGALALPLLQLAACAAALCAAWACRRRPCHPRDTRDTRDNHHQRRDSFLYHRYDDASAPPQYKYQ